MRQKRLKKKKEEEFLVCVVCGKDKKVPKGAQCCGKEMLAKDKAWTD